MHKYQLSKFNVIIQKIVEKTPIITILMRFINFNRYSYKNSKKHNPLKIN